MKAVFAAIILLSVVLGILVAPYFSLSMLSLFALFSIFFILSLSVIPKRWLWLAMIATSFLFLGIFRYIQVQNDIYNISYPTGQDLVVKGQVMEPPEETDKAVKAVLQDEAKGGKILLILKPFTKVKYGERLSVNGKISVPVKQYQNSLLVKGIAYEMAFPQVKHIGSDRMNITMRIQNSLYALRDSFEDSINRIFPEPEASFLAGLLLGVKRNLPSWLMQDLQASGTTHLIALSGFNITVIIEALRLIFRRRSAKFGFYIPLLAIFAFVVMTGSSSSVVRAGIMGSMMLLAYRVGRQSSATMAIIITAALMVFANPFILRYDAGFQLSFVAFIGIIYIAPLVRGILPLKHQFIKEMLAMTLGAQIMAYPLILHYFGTLSIVSFAANLVVLPFIPFVMLLGFLAALFGMVWQNLGFIFSFTALFALKAVISVIHCFAVLPYASFSGVGFSVLSVFIYYIIVLELIFICKRLKTRCLHAGS